MQSQKRRLKSAVQPARDHHRQTLLAVIYLCSVVLSINAWLISQQMISF